MNTQMMHMFESDDIEELLGDEIDLDASAD